MTVATLPPPAQRANYVALPLFFRYFLLIFSNIYKYINILYRKMPITSGFVKQNCNITGQCTPVPGTGVVCKGKGTQCENPTHGYPW